MTEKIGKYRILERVGRGGMGTVFKAHDPVLNRLVALKVISADVEVTEELKARFYREARACAKLNHPNIIVVYDLGEDGQQLYIVMEFLEGEELKRIIAEARSVPLEDKLAWMTQICEGLHFAHQHGVVHRDVKPGNIFIQRNGQVKILDFGIARIAAAESGLTRTGLIMGTLRYMSPEQARGRVDHRSDMFSVASVFYELLAYRPAFDRENPVEILEQLRTEAPPPLGEVDPSLPRELASIIARAHRKDPAERFADLGQMRDELEAVRRRLGDEAETLLVDVRAQLDEVRALQAALAGRLDAPSDDATLPVVDSGAPVSTLRALRTDLTAQITHLRTRLEAAEAVDPILARGQALLQGGEVEAAVTEFERVLHEVPGHPRALAGLRQARGIQGAPAPEAARLPAPDTAPPAATPAEAALAVAEPAPAVTAVAEPPPAPAPPTPPAAAPPIIPSPPVVRARRFGRTHAAVAAGLLVILAGGGTWWLRARSGASTTSSSSAARPDPAPPTSPAPVPTPAPPAPAVPTPEPRKAEAERAREAMVSARDAARQAEAETLVPSLWDLAVKKAQEAEAAQDQKDFAGAETRYREADEAYERAASGAREAAEVRRAQGEVAEARRAAQGAEAARLVPPLWARATSAERQAEDAVRRQDLGRAQTLLQDAATAFREAEREAARKTAAVSAAERERIATVQRELAATEVLVQAVAARRREAEQAGASRHAAATLAQAQEKEKEGRAALLLQNFALARQRLQEAQQTYQRAAAEARQAVKR
jgi:hypothetical protein